ncbi:hypothetical protein [Allocoleopsis sp.]|uniref:hypothetical protein n=1 Tax=Allocoleopsis sp. TaxID=3088169 RepID=UPI002FCF4781
MEGQLIGGRYQIINQLGRGGYGITFLAEDRQLPGNPRCIVKQLNPEVTESNNLQVAAQLFNAEAQVLYRLGNHPQIPQLLAHFEENQEFYGSSLLGMPNYQLKRMISVTPRNFPQLSASAAPSNSK